MNVPKDSDREFLLKLIDSLLTIKETFEQDTKKLVGPLYQRRLGNLEVLDSVIPRIRDHLAVGLGIDPLIDETVNGVEIHDEK